MWPVPTILRSLLTRLALPSEGDRVVLRIALLCAIEAAIVVLLAVQVFGRPTGPTVPVHSGHGITPPQDSTLPTSAASSGTTPHPTHRNDERTTVRSAVTARWNADDPV